jgi:uncharacterized membrane protein YgaE (UPF0421/DUF939 family)
MKEDTRYKLYKLNKLVMVISTVIVITNLFAFIAAIIIDSLISPFLIITTIASGIFGSLSALLNNHVLSPYQTGYRYYSHKWRTIHDMW